METIINNIVGRCHCMDDYLTVVRYTLSRLKGKRKAFLRLPRADRREILRLALTAHKRNRGTYLAVMTGSF